MTDYSRRDRTPKPVSLSDARLVPSTAQRYMSLAANLAGTMPDIPARSCFHITARDCLRACAGARMAAAFLMQNAPQAGEEMATLALGHIGLQARHAAEGFERSEVADAVDILVRAAIETGNTGIVNEGIGTMIEVLNGRWGEDLCLGFQPETVHLAASRLDLATLDRMLENVKAWGLGSVLCTLIADKDIEIGKKEFLADFTRDFVTECETALNLTREDYIEDPADWARMALIIFSVTCCKGEEAEDLLAQIRGETAYAHASGVIEAGRMCRGGSIDWNPARITRDLLSSLPAPRGGSREMDEDERAAFRIGDFVKGFIEITPKSYEAAMALTGEITNARWRFFYRAMLIPSAAAAGGAEKAAEALEDIIECRETLLLTEYCHALSEAARGVAKAELSGASKEELFAGIAAAVEANRPCDDAQRNVACGIAREMAVAGAPASAFKIASLLPVEHSGRCEAIGYIGEAYGRRNKMEDAVKCLSLSLNDMSTASLYTAVAMEAERDEAIESFQKSQNVLEQASMEAIISFEGATHRAHHLKDHACRCRGAGLHDDALKYFRRAVEILDEKGSPQAAWTRYLVFCDLLEPFSKGEPL